MIFLAVVAINCCCHVEVMLNSNWYVLSLYKCLYVSIHVQTVLHLDLVCTFAWLI